MDINQTLKELDSLDYTQVEGFLKEKIEEAKSAQDDASQITLLNELLGFLRDTCQHEKNDQVAKDLLAVLHRQHLEGSQAYATSLLNIANAYRAAGRHEESLAYYRQVDKIYVNLISKDDYLYACLYNNMSLLYQEMGQFEDACDCLQKALSIVEKIPERIIEVATTHTNLAQSLLVMGKIEACAEHLQKAFDIFATDGNKDYHYSGALAVCGQLKYVQKEYEEAAKYFDMAMTEFEKHMGRGGNYDLLKENRDNALAMAKKEQEPEINKAGLEICEDYYNEYGAPMIHEKFPEYEKEIAVGLVGDGSECFGCDDEISRDHDWGPGFCMWITDELYGKIGDKLQEEYNNLPKTYKGYTRVETNEGNGRVGVFTICGFYQKYLPYIDIESVSKELSDADRSLQEENLAVITNGKVFRDDRGEFTAIRDRLLHYYPENIRQQRLAIELIMMAKTGQYNFPRMLQRSDKVTANMYLGQFMEHTLKAVFILNRKYSPYTKWLWKQAAGLERLAEVTDVLCAIMDMSITDERIPQIIEIIAQLFIDEMVVQGIVDQGEITGLKDPRFLESYGRLILNNILDIQQETASQNGNNHLKENNTNYKKDNCMEYNMTKEQLVDELVQTEWKAFDKVQNEGGRADCQDNWNTFSAMRKSQYLEWSEEMLQSYLNDFKVANEKGWNLITEKYGRMEESTAPEEYAKIKDSLPPISPEKKAIMEEIIKIQVGFMEDLAAKYPKVAGTARTIHTADDTPYDTSYETYLRGELGTYSDETLSLYGRFIVGLVQSGQNLAMNIMTNTAHMYGYKDLEDLENKLD